MENKHLLHDFFQGCGKKKKNIHRVKKLQDLASEKNRNMDRLYHMKTYIQICVTRKTQISLCKRSLRLIGFFPICMKYQSGNDSDQPPWMCRLNRIFIGPLICIHVCFLPMWSIFSFFFCCLFQ